MRAIRLNEIKKSAYRLFARPDNCQAEEHPAPAARGDGIVARVAIEFRKRQASPQDHEDNARPPVVN